MSKTERERLLAARSQAAAEMDYICDKWSQPRLHGPEWDKYRAHPAYIAAMKVRTIDVDRQLPNV